MSKPWVTQPRDRLAKKFQELHRQLRKELYKPEPEPTKIERKRAASRDFRTRGGE